MVTLIVPLLHPRPLPERPLPKPSPDSDELQNEPKTRLDASFVTGNHSPIPHLATAEDCWTEARLN
jgi:hypothetical protein